MNVRRALTDKRWAFVIFLLVIIAGLLWQSWSECDEGRGGSCAIIPDNPSENRFLEVIP